MTPKWIEEIKIRRYDTWNSNSTQKSFVTLTMPKNIKNGVINFLEFNKNFFNRYKYVDTKIKL